MSGKENETTGAKSNAVSTSIFNPQNAAFYNEKAPASVAGERGFFLLQAYKPCCKLLLAFPEHLSRSCGVACGIGKVMLTSFHKLPAAEPLMGLTFTIILVCYLLRSTTEIAKKKSI